MKIQDILDLTPEQLRKMSTSDLRKVTQQMADAANKRVRRLAQDEIGRTSRLGAAAVEKGLDKPYYSMKGLKARGDVRSMFNTLRNVMNPGKQIYNLRSWKNVVKQIEERIGGKLTPEQWKAYREMEASGSFPQGYDSNDAQRMLIQIKNQGADDNMETYIEIMTERMQQVYEQQQREYNEMYGNFHSINGDKYEPVDEEDLPF